MSQALTSSGGTSSSAVTVTAPRTQQTWRVPRARLLVNGKERPETRLVEFTLDRTRYARADTAQVTLAVDRVALAALTAPFWFDPATPAGNAMLPDITVAIQMRDEAIANAQWEQVFAGIVDAVEW